MGQLVSHSSDFPPLDFGIRFAYFLGDLTGGLTDDFKGTDHRIHCLVIIAKIIIVHAIYKRKRLFCVLQHIAQIVFVLTLHTGTASRRMFFPMAGLSESFITKSTLTPSKSDK